MEIISSISLVILTSSLMSCLWTARKTPKVHDACCQSKLETQDTATQTDTLLAPAAPVALHVITPETFTISTQTPNYLPENLDESKMDIKNYTINTLRTMIACASLLSSCIYGHYYATFQREI